MRHKNWSIQSPKWANSTRAGGDASEQGALQRRLPFDTSNISDDCSYELRKTMYRNGAYLLPTDMPCVHAWGITGNLQLIPVSHKHDQMPRPRDQHTFACYLSCCIIRRPFYPLDTPDGDTSEIAANYMSAVPSHVVLREPGASAVLTLGGLDSVIREGPMVTHAFYVYYTPVAEGLKSAYTVNAQEGCQWQNGIMTLYRVDGFPAWVNGDNPLALAVAAAAAAPGPRELVPDADTDQQLLEEITHQNGEEEYELQSTGESVDASGEVADPKRGHGGGVQNIPGDPDEPTGAPGLAGQLGRRTDDDAPDSGSDAARILQEFMERSRSADKDSD